MYIGKGTDSRAWNNKRTNQEHKHWIDEQIHLNNWGNCVQILLSDLTSSEARLKEVELILENKPIWNSEGKEYICEHCSYIAKSPAGKASHIRNNH